MCSGPLSSGSRGRLGNAAARPEGYRRKRVVIPLLCDPCTKLYCWAKTWNVLLLDFTLIYHSHHRPHHWPGCTRFHEILGPS